MYLGMMNEGERARVVSIHGGHGLRQKLSLRGIFEGSIVRVISRRGPTTIEVNRNIVTIGRGMARKIRVVRM
ncbi:MAG: FeoA family protein [Euryarchaeota archaeon]|nr:FeoA family protein [Euryarchaeota archaeon]